MSNPETTDEAMTMIAREWTATPAMPTEELYQSAERNLLARVEARYGAAASREAWAKYGSNKGWHE